MSLMVDVLVSVLFGLGMFFSCFIENMGVLVCCFMVVLGFVGVFELEYIDICFWVLLLLMMRCESLGIIWFLCRVFCDFVGCKVFEGFESEGFEVFGDCEGFEDFKDIEVCDVCVGFMDLFCG